MRRCDVRCCEINPVSVCFNFKTQVLLNLSFSSFAVHNRGIVVRCWVGGKRLFPLSRMIHSYSGTQKNAHRGSLPWVNAATAWSWPLLPIAETNKGYSPMSTLLYVFVTCKITPGPWPCIYPRKITMFDPGPAKPPKWRTHGALHPLSLYAFTARCLVTINCFTRCLNTLVKLLLPEQLCLRRIGTWRYSATHF